MIFLNLWIDITAFVLLTFLSGVVYRFGGSSKGDTLFRDIGCPVVSLLILYLFTITHKETPIWASVLYLLMAYGSMTTYHSWLSRLLGYYDGRERWFNWLMHGLVCAFSAFILCFFLDNWMWFSIRCLVVSFGMMLVSELSEDVYVEEAGRGIIFSGTIPILFIGV
jgi:hypothetical protein